LPEYRQKAQCAKNVANCSLGRCFRARSYAREDRLKQGRVLVMEIRFKLEKETKGALRYQEVDDKGEVIEQAWAKIGTLYMRKSAFERGASFPQMLRVTVDTA
jgi:hypothetical protein